MPDTQADRIAATFKDHPEIQGHLTLVDELDDDAGMVEQVIKYVARRSGERAVIQAQDTKGALYLSEPPC